MREYVARTTRERFQEARHLRGAPAAAAITEGQAQLALVRRQATIAGLYPPGERSVLEAPANLAAAKAKARRRDAV